MNNGFQTSRQSGAEMRREYQKEYRGKYRNGKIELLQETDLEEGEEVLIYPDLIRYRKRKDEGFSETPGGGQEDTCNEGLTQTRNDEWVGG